MLRADNYHVLISDIEMPGNCELELIKEIPRIAEGMPIILVTGNPSLDTAIQSIQLPVVACMIKPFEFEELLAHVKTSIKRYRTYLEVRDICKRIRKYH